MIYFFKNIIDNILNSIQNLVIDDKDFINELVLNGCDCYLTGNALSSKLFDYWYGDFTNNLIDRDIYVENIHPKDLMRIIIKYGDVYVYGVKNYNFRKNHKKIRFLLVPYGENASYEFTFDNNYGALINSMTYKINNKSDIETIDFNDLLYNFNMFEEIEKRTWENNNELEYFKKFENIMRCFNLCVYYNLKLKETTIENIKNSVNNYIKYMIQYSQEIVFEELVKILNLCDDTIILKIMNDTGCFDLMNMKFKNFEKTIDELIELDNDNNIIKFVKLLDGLNTDNLKRWCVANNVNKAKNITNNIKKYYIIFENYQEYLDIKTKCDALKFLTKINNKINYGTEYDFFREGLFESFNYYVLNIKLIEYEEEKYEQLFIDCDDYPISIKTIDIDDLVLNKKFNIIWSDIKKTKENLLDLIHNDKLINNYDEIIEYLEKQI